MEEDTLNKRLNADKPGMKWSYRIIDGSYRVHTRLYKLHYAIVHTERTIFDLLRNNFITSNLVIITTLVSLTFLYIQITGAELSSGSWGIFALLIALLVLEGGIYFNQAKKIENKLLEMSSEITEESLEQWPDYLGDEVDKWCTRILMVKEILKENENIPSDEQDESYRATEKNFTRILNYSIGELKKKKKECEASSLAEIPEYKDYYDETIQTCNVFIELGEKV